MPHASRKKRIVLTILVGLALLAVIASLAGAQEGGDQTGGDQTGGDQSGPPAGGTYTVQYGDTLDVLAQNWNVSVVALMRANNITDSYSLKAGDTLVVPPDLPPYGAFPALEDTTAGAGGGAAGDTYVVQPGDTLDTIGQRLDVSAVSLRVANNIDNPRSITPGMVLVIPADAPPYGVFPALGTGGATTTTTGQGGDTTAGQGGGAVEGNTYVVQPNDTLDTIAQQLNVSVVSLRTANNVTNSRALMPGTTLVIPADAPPYGVYPATDTGQGADTTAGQGGGGVAGDTYVVQPADTLDTIAQRLNVSVVSLKVANNITNARTLMPGTTLVIPADAPEYGVFPALGTGGATDTSAGQGGGGVEGETYVVQPNDTLDTIAQRLNVSLISLEKANDIANTRRLFPGTTLVIPADAPPYGQFPPLENAGSADSTLGQGGGGNVYVVQLTDTLDQIAARAGVDTQCLAESNQIDPPGRIHPGQVIVIDTTCPSYQGPVAPQETAPTEQPVPATTETPGSG